MGVEYFIDTNFGARPQLVKLCWAALDRRHLLPRGAELR
jgi:hypothetical protein